MIHPETGQLLETHDEIVSAIARIEERFAPLYRMRRALQEGLTEFEAVLPPARARTPTQDRVARCPRCGVKLEKEEGTP